ncbi:hypothetical protein GWK47_051340 [Chionoecetes opilio]|uniref:Uncharacterized protein n=1 Tax=Chionoecetes opilio TaxID=41210 RepID=A0A8J4Y0X6_CHIOP|nr:hypothetical protein GWK47_051340 [Chionoecetes opilio]
MRSPTLPYTLTHAESRRNARPGRIRVKRCDRTGRAGQTMHLRIMWMTEGNTCDVTGHVTRSWSAAGGPPGISHTPCSLIAAPPRPAPPSGQGVAPCIPWHSCRTAKTSNRWTRRGGSLSDSGGAGGRAEPDRRHDRSCLTPSPPPSPSPARGLGP